ncbi:MAG: signal recognition particle-docking protein FtsY [Lachnospiraceae bacterium]|jgi:fused signal recognition particle receptor|nr:signal recognition particle-docking protein FtsY [Lachnospiraceae bacterium]
MEDKELDETLDGSLPEKKEKKGFFKRLVEGLTKTRNSISSGLEYVFNGFTELDDDFYEELEEVLIMADIGVKTTDEIIEHLKESAKENKIKHPNECREFLFNYLKEKLKTPYDAYQYEDKTSVLLLIGVNGVGKTTTCGKLAGNLKANGKKVLLAAADTFRAAAIDQLEEWSRRVGVDIISHQEGSDPAAVVYDAVAAAKARHADVLICDTAGRLHNKKNLMEELRKISRVIEREYPEAFIETLVVVDGTTGQNALNQAKEFAEVADIDGIVLTKLDGTAKGGIAIAIQSELNVPVKYIGVGEKMEDLQKFDSDSFVEALFKKDNEEK